MFAYRLLVQDAKSPEWSRRSIRGLAFRRDLYTVFTGGQESDSFETWIAREYEQPALKAIGLAVAGRRLTPSDRRNLARFVAAQDVRTPLSLVESMQRWARELPDLLNSVVQEGIERLERAREQGDPFVRPDSRRNEFAEMLEVTIDPPEGGSDQATVRAGIGVGPRQFWIANMRHLLNGAAEILTRQRWGIIEPADDLEWPLTDHPVLRLNYYGPGSYDFGGGWGRPGCDILMALSPRHLLHTQVGSKDLPEQWRCSRAQTELLQRLLLQRAYQWVFASSPVQWMCEVRPRIVDRELFKGERKAWDEWHREQLGAEMLADARRRRSVVS